MKHQWLLACALATASFAAYAGSEAVPQDDCAAAEASLPPRAILDLLDPQAPVERRQEALAAYERVAPMRGCPGFGYTLGQLYRHGPYLPGNLVPQDLPKARELIKPMAMAGDLGAFADLAEMEMRHANAREAMLWTQLYLHFVKNVRLDYVDDPDDVRFENSAYNSNLLGRVELIWRMARPRLPRKLVAADLDAWLAEHGAEVTRRMRRRMQDGDAHVLPQTGPKTSIAVRPGTCYLNLPGDTGAGAATWIVEVLPSGQAGRIVLENLVPNAKVAGRLAACLSRYSFRPFEGERPAFVRIPMVVGTPAARGLSRRNR